MSSDVKKPQALSGLKVADFSWVIAGPFSTKILADHGATVVKIESEKRIDVFRSHTPMVGGIPGINRCVAFAAYNSSKYSMKLNLNNPKGLEIAKKLIAWADIVVENFMAGTMEKWGLDYEGIKKINPRIIMLRASTFGQDGPLAKQPAFGVQLQALSGLTAIGGWPDMPPVGASVAYTDFIGPWYGLVAILAALDYRERTGEGQCIDLSQLETAADFQAPAILDYNVNGIIQKAQGNSSRYAAPHAAYRCKGNDRWCTIAVFSDDEWKRCCEVMGNPAWAKDKRFSNLESRKENEAELDKLIESWTVNYSPEEVMNVMQNTGIAAGIAEDGKDLHEDPQLKHRNHFWMLNHPEMGTTAYDDFSCRFSETASELRPAPCMGEHTAQVCSEILGIPDEEFIQLLEEGVFT